MREGFSHFSLHVRVVMDLSCIAKLHSTRHLFITIINTVVLRLSCMSVPPIAHVVAPCFVWPFLTSLSLFSRLFDFSTHEFLSAYYESLCQFPFRECRRQCAPTQIFHVRSFRYVQYLPPFSEWVEQIYHETFVYLNDHFQEKRKDPKVIHV